MADYATLLRQDVSLTVRSVDRIFLQAYIPQLQSVGWVCRFLHYQRGFKIPSSAAFGQIGRRYVEDIRRWVAREDIPLIEFKKDENKEARARPLIEAAAQQGGDGRVVLVGKAQEKTSAWKSWVGKGQQGKPHPHMEWGRQSVYPDHYYFYVFDPDWGPAFWKTNAYAPYPVWICLNGHEWAKRQLEKAGIGYRELDNGFLSCEDPSALQRICDRLGPGAVKNFFWRWFWRLPAPLTQEDLKAGYGYELAYRQFEISDTRVFKRPAAGRAWFEGVIRDHLDVGRPRNVALTFDRRINARTRGSFSTKVITRGVNPQLSFTYKSCRMKQYFKEDHALRTETVIADTRDFGIGRRVNIDTWKALRAVGDNANRRLCDAQAQDARPAPDVVTVREVTRPSKTPDGLHAPGLCFGDPRVMALFAALVMFSHFLAGFRNRQLVDVMGQLLGVPYSTRQATYDLRRLRRKGLIERVPYSHRYLPTAEGRAVAVLFGKVQGRVLGKGFALLDLALPAELAQRHPLARDWRRLHRTLEDFIERQMIAA